MKKIICIALLLFSTGVFAQTPFFEPGENVVGAGFGIGGLYYHDYTSSSPMFYLNYERAMGLEVGPGTLGLGGMLGYKYTRYKHDLPDQYYYDWSTRYVIVGLRGAYHYDLFKVSDLDTYAGIMMSYNFVSVSDNSDVYTNFDYNTGVENGFGFTPFAGARYYFNQNWGVNAEAGVGSYFFTFGMNYKF